VSPEGFLVASEPEPEPEPLRVLGFNATTAEVIVGVDFDEVGDMGDISSASSVKLARKESGLERILRSTCGRRRSAGGCGGSTVGVVGDVMPSRCGWEMVLVLRLRSRDRRDGIVFVADSMIKVTE
jgi:hypothetical protein